MNAIILAAGMSSRFAPLSYEKPKGLLNVKGEILIERQIEQLKAAGVEDITLVVGYMKESFFYLEEKYGVDIVVNEDYFRYNNTSSLIAVLDRLGDTFICSSDNYFTENVFVDKPEEPYYAAAYAEGETDEYCLQCDADDWISGVTIGGRDSWFMIGQVFFTKSFSEKFKALLAKDYDQEQTRHELWEDFYMKHLDELHLKIKKYPSGVIQEFDSLDELRRFDDRYVCNTDSRIIANICEVLVCREEDITDIHPIKQGLTNTSFYFTVNRGDRIEKFVYRHPGIGTDKYINRNSEVFSMGIAKDMGLDDTFIYMSPSGWKISRYIENARTLDYHNPEDVSQALSMVRKLHDANIKSDFDFHVWDRSKEFVAKIHEKGEADFPDFQELYAEMEVLFYHTKEDNVPECLTHCDCYDPDFLIGEDGKMYLIDWEYSGNDDPASDMGTFICCSDYTYEEALNIIEEYLGHKPNSVELRHHLAYVSLAAYYWYVWAIYQTSIGNDVGEYLLLWYNMSKSYCKKAMSLYLNK